MRRRIHHWSSQGFIYYLGQVNEITLRDAAPAVTALRNDVSLSTKLIEMDLDNIFQDVVTNTSTGMPLAITSLLNACQDMQGMPRREEPEEDDEVSCLYNRTTCFEFHRLLVFTLLSFGKALDGYADAYGKYFEDLLKHAKKSTYGVLCSGPLDIRGY